MNSRPPTRRRAAPGPAEPAARRGPLVAPAAGVHRFDAFELDTAARELRRQGHALAIAPQAFSVLAELVQQRGRAVSRDELQQRVWPGVAVSEGSLRQAIWEVRQALGDDAESPRYVRTQRGRGYSFVGDVSFDPHAATGTRPERVEAAVLVGREAELARLRSALAGAMEQSGRACLLRGAPGMGKSRLARELVHHARSVGVLCLESAAERDTGLPPFWPFIQLLNGFFHDLGADERARCEASAPAVFQMLARAGGPSAARPVVFTDGPDLQRLYLFEELTRLFGVVARETPLLLLLEDVQWMDEPSIAFLRYFLGTLPRSRVLLVLTCRTLTRGQNRGLARAVDVLTRGALNEIIDLSLLGPEQVAELLTSHGGRAPSPEVAAQVHALTAGNPLFALEVTRLLGAAAPESSDDGLFTRADPELRGVIRKRLASLPEYCREAALAASIWGDTCGAAELAVLLDETVDETILRIDACVHRGIFVEGAAPLRFGFAHPLVAEVAYEMLPSADRRKLHRAAGLWLERKVDSQFTHLSALAHHFSCAATPDVARQAIEYASRCAERAYATTAYETALLHCNRALSVAELYGDVTPTQRLALELLRVEAERAAGRRSEAINATFLELAGRATALGEPRLLARAALGYSGQRPVVTGQVSFDAMIDPVGISLLERARASVDPADLELRALLTCALSLALMDGPERARREALADESIALARAAERPALIAHVLAFRTHTCAAPDAYESLCGALEQLLALACVHDLKEVEHGARLRWLVCALAVGDLDTAQMHDARARVLAEMLGSPRARANSDLLPMFEAFWRGDIQQAERLFASMLEVLGSDFYHQTMHLARLTVVELLRGGYAYLPTLITKLVALLATFPQVVSCHCTLAGACTVMGDFEAARAHFDAAAGDNFRAIPENVQWLAEMLALADAAVRLNDVSRAQLVYDRLLPYADRLAFYQGQALPAGPVARALTELATVLGDYEEAARFLAISRALNARLGASMFAQYDTLSEVRLLARTRPSGWRARAGELIAEVVASARQSGSRWLEDDAQALQCSLLETNAPVSLAERRARSSGRR